MPNLYTVRFGGTATREGLQPREKFSIYYHSQFDYPLSFADLIKWGPGTFFPKGFERESYVFQNGYFTVHNKEGTVYKKLLRGRISEKKIELAQKAAGYLSFLPTVKMVALTGSLAMKNATDGGDIDLFIVTGNNTLWLTRLLVYILLRLARFDLRGAGDARQKDRFCLNMWMDEEDLIWAKKDRNYYTAHEIAQITPLVNKAKAYERFIYENRWTKNFWPNAVRISSKRQVISDKRGRDSVLGIAYFWLLSIVEKLAYHVQYLYMRRKITREIVTPSRAIFHPQDWGGIVMERLAS